MISQRAQQLRAELAREVLDETPIALKRIQWEDSAQNQSTPAGVNVNYLPVGGVPCLLCTPEKLNSKTTIVYCHGGGLVEGSVETHRIWTSRLALHTGCKVISIQYRLAPEHPYPAAVEDVLSVCNALSTSADFSDGFCIGADSTGCVLGLLALLNSKPNTDYKPSCAFFLSPSIDLTFSGATIDTNASLDPLVSVDILRHYAKVYVDDKDTSDPDISPLLAELHNIPPLLIMVDDQEVLFDDAIRLARKVIDAGGIAKLHITQGLWHVWPLWGDFPESTIALNMIDQHISNPTGACSATS